MDAKPESFRGAYQSGPASSFKSSKQLMLTGSGPESGRTIQFPALRDIIRGQPMFCRSAIEDWRSCSERHWRVVRTTTSIALAVFAAVASNVDRASAAENATRCGAPPHSLPGLADIDAASRLAFIRGTMDDQARRSQIWKWAWTVAGSSLVAGNFLAAARTPSHSNRADSIVGGAGSLLIPLSILIQPPVVLGDRTEVERNANESTDRCAALARAEELFARDAGNQARTTSIGVHAASIGSNVTVALVMGFGFGHWRGAAWAGGGGTLISEAFIFTRPRGTIGALKRYRNGDLASPNVSSRLSVVPFASRSLVGAQLLVVF